MNYCDGPSGSGKTTAIAKRIIELVREKQQNVILVQPSRKLIEQTRKLFGSIRCEVIHGEEAKHTIRKIIDYFQHPYPEPHLLIITWAAFEMLPCIFRPQGWAIILDETPQVHAYECHSLPLNHSLITEHIRTEPRGSVYGRVFVEKDQAEFLRKIVDVGQRDKATKDLVQLCRRLLSPFWESYVEESQYRALLRGETNELRIFQLLKPAILQPFRSVTIAAARFEETLLCKLWSICGIDFRKDDGLCDSLRYKEHEGGKNITICYAMDVLYSKNLRDKDDQRVFDLYKTAAEIELGTRSFLWIANNDIKDITFSETANTTRLPNSPHGLNEFRHIDCFASFSALNLRSEHAEFLKWLGVSEDEIRIATYCHVVYQAALRCSIRDLDNRSQKILVVPDFFVASYLQRLCKGSVLKNLGIDFGSTPLKGSPGRKPEYGSANERKRASYERRKAQLDFELGNLFRSLSGPNEIGSDLKKSYDENPYIVPYKELINMEGFTHTRHLGSIWPHKKSIEPLGCIYGTSIDQLARLFRTLSKRRIGTKEDNMLMSSSFFIPDYGAKEYKGKKNVVSSNGIFLDFDGGNLTPNMLAKIFPRIRLLAFNTWSSTKEIPRWRAYIPTSNVMSATEYEIITRQILNRVREHGYILSKPDLTIRTIKAHGIDLGKLHAASLFYLPCLPANPSGRLFKDFKKDRELLNPLEWLLYAQPVEEKKTEFENHDDEISLELIQPYLNEWASEGTKPGNGDTGIWKLARGLKEKKVGRQQATQILIEAARLAHTPKDRLRQVDNILKNVWRNK
jgi:hypothetical protein